MIRTALTDSHARLLAWDFACEHRETRSLAGWARRYARFVGDCAWNRTVNIELLARPGPIRLPRLPPPASRAA